MATALQLQPAAAYTAREEWERLPWLFDEPRRARPSPGGGMLVLIVAAVTADALGSYAAGRLSGGGGWAAGLAEGRQPAAVRPLSADLTLPLAREISAAEQVGWQRRRANAAY